MDTATQIRAALKAAGIASRQVSVVTDSYSMGSSVRVRIKVAAVSKARVEELARPFEHVRRDHSGEILGGGNTFVDVDYTAEAVAPLIAGYLMVLEGLENQAFGVLVALVGLFLRPAYGAASAARQLAEHVLSHGVVACGHSDCAECPELAAACASQAVAA